MSCRSSNSFLHAKAVFYVNIFFLLNQVLNILPNGEIEATNSSYSREKYSFKINFLMLIFHFFIFNSWEDSKIKVAFARRECRGAKGKLLGIPVLCGQSPASVPPPPSRVFESVCVGMRQV